MRALRRWRRRLLADRQPWPCARRPPGKSYRENRVILGTHTSESDQNYLMLAKVTTPMEHEDSIENRKYDEYTQEAGGYGQNRAKVEIVQRINHDGEVNRARYLPQNPTVMATKGPSKDVLVFDYTKHPSQPANDGVCRPQVRLCGHTDEGYGLCWNPLQVPLCVRALCACLRGHWRARRSALGPTPCRAGVISCLCGTHGRLFGYLEGGRAQVQGVLTERVCRCDAQEGVVVSASNDGNICMWDVESKTEDKRCVCARARCARCAQRDGHGAGARVHLRPRTHTNLRALKDAHAIARAQTHAHEKRARSRPTHAHMCMRMYTCTLTLTHGWMPRIPSPLATFAAHKGAAQDVTCSTFQAHTFASVGDDGFLMMYVAFLCLSVCLSVCRSVCLCGVGACVRVWHAHTQGSGACVRGAVAGAARAPQDAFSSRVMTCVCVCVCDQLG